MDRLSSLQAGQDTVLDDVVYKQVRIEDDKDKMSNIQEGQDSGQAEQYRFKQDSIVDEQDRLSNICKQGRIVDRLRNIGTSRSGWCMNRTG